MTTGIASLKKFVLHIFLWLPLCSAAWYLSAQAHTAGIGMLARFLVNQITTGIVSALERSGLDLVFVTNIRINAAPGQAAVWVPEVNPLLYTFSLALFLSLMLAERAKWWKILVGAAVLVPFQSWGVAFDVLSQGIQLGQDFSEQAGLFGWRLIAVAVGYQLGLLIFPTLVPVLLWASFSQLFRESVRRAQMQNFQRRH